MSNFRCLGQWTRGILTLGLMWVSQGGVVGEEYLTGIRWPEPPIVSPGDSGGPPSDAKVLFGGTDMDAWENGENWPVEDGVVVCGRGDIRSKESFGDCQLHVEWSAPVPATGAGQGRGNSGIFLMDVYELQVLDSYDNSTYFDGQAGAIYKQTPPMVNAMRPPGEWNVYDIFWTAPRFNDDGSLAAPAYITALHNGVLILNHFELLGDTPFTDLRATPRSLADPHSGSWQSGAVSQHLGSRMDTHPRCAGTGALYTRRRPLAKPYRISPARGGGQLGRRRCDPNLELRPRDDQLSEWQLLTGI